MRTLRTVTTLCSIIVLLSAAPPVIAQEQPRTPSIKPDAVEVTTPVYRPEFSEFDPALGMYVYRVSWQGIPAAEVTVNVEEQGTTYKVVADARTYSAIDLFYKLRYRAEGIVSALDLMPEKMTIEHRENSRMKTVDMQFRSDGSIHSVWTYLGKSTEVYDFNPKNFTLDPFSAAFLARSLNWRLGETKQFDTFNGKSRYLISLTAVDRRWEFIDGVNHDVWVISPKVVKLTDPSAEGKLRDAEIFVTANKSRDVLKIVSEVFVGSVTTKLTSFTPSAAPSMRARLAQSSKPIIK